MQLEMGRFWDQRAEENALYFIDNRLDYRHPDAERFWADGERDLDAMLAALGVSIGPHDRVLEIGCGIGRLTRVISRRAASVKAIDVSERMLADAQRHHPELSNVEWLLGDGTSLARIETASVDACISSVVFQHIPDPAITLGYVREMGRVLRPGGWSAFQLSNDSRAHRPRRARLAQAALALLGRGPRGQHDPRWLGSMVELRELRAAVEDASMHLERVVGEGTQMCGVLTRRVAA